MKAGTSKVEITPPIGVKLGGFAARYKGSEGVHDPLYARTLYIKGEERSLLLISNDLVNVPDSIVSSVRAEVTSRTDLEEEGILISATHTHSGPSLSPDIAAEVPSASAAHYRDILTRRIIKAALQAAESPRKAKMGWATAKATIAFNRRNKDGPRDDEVGTLLVTDESNGSVASLVNYACHGVVLGD